MDAGEYGTHVPCVREERLARWADRAYLSARPGVDTHILDGEPVVVRRGGDVLGLDKAGNVESNLLLTCRYGRTLSQSTSK